MLGEASSHFDPWQETRHQLPEMHDMEDKANKIPPFMRVPAKLERTLTVIAPTSLCKVTTRIMIATRAFHHVPLVPRAMCASAT
jgi:hypothetical protein